MGQLPSSKRLPSADEIISSAPVSREALAGVARHREEVRRILRGEDKRFLVIVGPCSAWPAPAVLDYARRLRPLAEELSTALKLVLRCYIQKPRTTRGWSGPVNQPNPFAPADISEGLRYSRRMMVQAVELGLPLADEAVFTHNSKGFMELLSWVAIGARSSEDQEHRIWASGQDLPVGLKNPTGGSIAIGINSVLAAQSAHTAVFDGHQVQTTGNSDAHLVLRGGATGPNYSLENLEQARRGMLASAVKFPALLVDASHDNCRLEGVKSPQLQIDVIRDVLQSLQRRPQLLEVMRGFMLESFLLGGNQDPDQCDSESVERGGLSITDPCLDWDQTESLLRETAAQVTGLFGAVQGRRTVDSAADSTNDAANVGRGATAQDVT